MIKILIYMLVFKNILRTRTCIKFAWFLIAQCSFHLKYFTFIEKVKTICLWIGLRQLSNCIRPFILIKCANVDLWYLFGNMAKLRYLTKLSLPFFLRFLTKSHEDVTKLLKTSKQVWYSLYIWNSFTSPENPVFTLTKW